MATNRLLDAVTEYLDAYEAAVRLLDDLPERDFPSWQPKSRKRVLERLARARYMLRLERDFAECEWIKERMAQP